MSPQALERQAKHHLANGRFRQAVDDYKALFKQDSDTYLPGLRTAYEGLYKQRLDKGMLTEAGMVLGQLEKLSGDSLSVESIRMWLKSREFLKRHQGHEALCAAKQSWWLKHSVEAAGLAFLACLQQQQFDAATQWYQRARIAKTESSFRPTA